MILSKSFSDELHPESQSSQSAPIFDVIEMRYYRGCKLTHVSNSSCVIGGLWSSVLTWKGRSRFVVVQQDNFQDAYDFYTLNSLYLRPKHALPYLFFRILLFLLLLSLYLLRDRLCPPNMETGSKHMNELCWVDTDLLNALSSFFKSMFPGRARPGSRVETDG
jgi:hypothetical protein